MNNDRESKSGIYCDWPECGCNPSNGLETCELGIFGQHAPCSDGSSRSNAAASDDRELLELAARAITIAAAEIGKAMG